MDVLIVFMCCLVVKSLLIVFLVIIGSFRYIMENLFLSLIDFVEVWMFIGIEVYIFFGFEFLLFFWR